MKIATIVVRSLLGLMFVFAGSNHFLNFAPLPPFPEGPAQNFISAIAASHYIYLVGALEVAGGLALLTGRWAPLGLTLLGPVIVNILAFNFLMVPSGAPVAFVLLALALFLVWRYRENFVGLVRPPQPARSEKPIGDARSQAAAAVNS
jgi:putative oxidoreductase